ASVTSATKFGLAVGGKCCHSHSTAWRLSGARSGTPTKFHSEIVRTSTSWAAASRERRSQLSCGLRSPAYPAAEAEALWDVSLSLIPNCSRQNPTHCEVRQHFHQYNSANTLVLLSGDWVLTQQPWQVVVLSLKFYLNFAAS